MVNWWFGLVFRDSTGTPNNPLQSQTGPHIINLRISAMFTVSFIQEHGGLLVLRGLEELTAGQGDLGMCVCFGDEILFFFYN